MHDSDALIGGAPAAPTGHIFDTGTARFAEDVLSASRSRPVIVDFWAEWCGPCKQLTPLLEAAVGAAGGKVALARVNVDENQTLAAQLRVQSLPMVYAFVDGQPVDGFAGALPATEVRAFVDRVARQSVGAVQEEIDQALEAADAALADDAKKAADLYTAVLERDGANARAIAGLGKALLKAGRTADARDILENISEDLVKDPAIESLRSAISLAAEASRAGDVPTLRAKVEANPDDHQARLDLANALLANDAREEAVDQLLESVRRDRQWNDAAARKRLLKLFEVFGEGDPLTAQTRMRLSAILFA